MTFTAWLWGPHLFFNNNMYTLLSVEMAAYIRRRKGEREKGRKGEREKGRKGEKKKTHKVIKTNIDIT